MEQPIKYWTPSISPSGMTFFKGDIYLAALGSEHLRRLILKKNQVVKEAVLFKEMEERVRQVRVSPDGILYFSTDSGAIYKVFP